MKFTSTITVALFSAFALSAVPACDDKKADDKKAEDKKDAKGKADDKKADDKKADEKKAEENKAEPAAEEKKADEAKADAPAGGGDKIGVAECDAFIEKYTKCINEKVDEAGRAAQQTGLDAMVKTFKEQAEGPGKEQLAAACQTASESSKASMTALGCAW